MLKAFACQRASIKTFLTIFVIFWTQIQFWICFFGKITDPAVNSWQNFQITWIHIRCGSGFEKWPGYRSGYRSTPKKLDPEMLIFEVKHPFEQALSRKLDLNNPGSRSRSRSTPKNLDPETLIFEVKPPP